MAGNETSYFELSFEPTVAQVSFVRRFVTECFRRVLDDDDGLSRVAMTTHELLENGVKYAKDGTTTFRIEIEHTAPRIVRVTLRNRAEEAHIAAIRDIVDRLTQAPDIGPFYQALIASNARQRAGSGLGLARICAEGEMKLAYAFHGDGVCLEATTRVETRTEP